MMQPVRFVFDNYFKIASALANDSLDGVASSTSAIATAIRRDSKQMLSPETAAQADVLAVTTELSHRGSYSSDLVCRWSGTWPTMAPQAFMLKFTAQRRMQAGSKERAKRLRIRISERKFPDAG